MHCIYSPATEQYIIPPPRGDVMKIRSYLAAGSVLWTFLLTVGFAAAATVIHVPADQPTIQAGINAASNGDTVLVSPGTYTENINFNGKAITVASTSGPGVTIIDADKLGPAATFISGESTTSVLKGFTLKNGVGAGAPYYTNGGGVAIAYSSPTITQNIIVDNVDDNGGGIGSSFGSPAITRNVIRNNKASLGAGVFIGGATVARFPPVVSNNVIEANATYDYYFGGGLALWAAGVVIVENNKIAGNQASDGQGGGVFIANEADAQFIQNVITGNSAGAGGGVYLSVPVSSIGLLFVNNTIAANNSADGSAVWAGGFDSNDEFFNNLIIGTAGQIAFHCDTLYSSVPPIVQFNDAWASSGTGFDGGCAGDSGSNGNISVDPIFVSPTKGNYRLLGGSPAIDVGDNAAPSVPVKDFAGNPRIVNGNDGPAATVDMGAYEFIPVALTPPTLNFGLQAVGSTTTKTVTLTNAQNKSLGISSKTLPTGYHVSGCGTSVAAFSSCSLTVTFHPLTSGSFKGALSIKDNAGNSPQQVNLFGSAH